MDVRCSHCNTEYEFDDALVSERGTTVKCTNCGHQFKVHPVTSSDGRGPERWVVRTGSGRELVYTSLRDLQKGISQRQIGPGDMLSRGSAVARPLGSIAELEPFFHGASRTDSRRNTQSGLGKSTPPPKPRRNSNNAGGVARPIPGRPARSGSNPPPKRRSSRPPPKPHIPVADRSIVEPLPQFDPNDEPEPKTIPRNARPLPAPAPVPKPAPQAPPVEERELVAAPEKVAIREREEVLTPTPSDVRESYREEFQTDPRFVTDPPARKSSSRWIAGLVVIGGLALLAGTVGRRYIEGFLKPQAEATASDARVHDMVTLGNKLLSEGDIDGAKEQFDKATVLAEKNPEALNALARLEAIRADRVWLELRLLDPADDALVQATNRRLAGRVKKAQSAADRVREVAPDNPATLRSRVDALRLAGDLDGARALAAPIAKTASEPESAYVLAAMDMAEKAPTWSTIIERLKTAVASESTPGRGHAAMVYAQARAGDVTGAQKTLDKIAGSTRPHPLLKELRDFVRRFESVKDGGAAPEVATVDPSKLPVMAASGDDDSVPARGLRGLLGKGNAALNAGNLDKAEAMFHAALKKDPGNTEALAGLGDVAKRRNDPDAAAKAYDKVLETNPSYIPAQIGRADALWAKGDRAAAIAIYRKVLASAGPGTSYGQHAAGRIAQGPGKPSAGSKDPAPPSTGGTDDPPSDPPEPEKPKDPPADDKPHIDTTDLE